MATISYRLKGKNNNVSIYIMLSISRGNVFERKTGYTINTTDWSKKKKEPIQRDADLKNLKTKLDTLKTEILKKYNYDFSSGIEINANWLENNIDEIQGAKKKTDLDRLTNYFDYYLNRLHDKIDKTGKKIGVSVSTLNKFKILKQKVQAFEKYTKKIHYIKDIGKIFSENFTNYLIKVEKLSPIYVGNLIKALKTLCRDAGENGIETHYQLNKIKYYRGSPDIIYLNFDELEQIENTIYKREALDNAKDWLILGCYIGQRVSDLLPLTSNNINIVKGVEMIELTQQKTGKQIVIPLQLKVKEILNKRNGEFPRKISDQKFNIYIKEVTKIAGLTEPTKGALIITKDIQGKREKRKQNGTYPKWQLITSHICRRSFATNFYGDTPTAYLISVTGHSTEKQFLEYIGKTKTDQAQQLAEYWTKEIMNAKKEPQLNIIKRAK